MSAEIFLQQAKHSILNGVSLFHSEYFSFAVVCEIALYIAFQSFFFLFLHLNMCCGYLEKYLMHVLQLF